MKKRLLATVVIGFALAASIVPVASAHPGHVRPSNTCYATVWNTVENGGQSPYVNGVSVRPTMEELDDIYGNYCGQIRSKNTVFRTSSTCNTVMKTELDAKYGGGNPHGENQATWSGCGGSYYALFGYGINPYGDCWEAYGEAGSGPVGRFTPWRCY